ncbi:MAG: hypothetical protein ACRC46_01965 [Thermoguttaceae bacterium]
MATAEQHLKIANNHQNFIRSVCNAVRESPEDFPPKVFCPLVVVACYYRVIHILEAIFDMSGKPHVFPADEAEADGRRTSFIKVLKLEDDIRAKYKVLRRLVLHAKYFPSGSPQDYDIVTDIDKLTQSVVKDHLVSFENLVAARLSIAVTSV